MTKATPRPERPDKLKQAARFTRDQVETALVLLEESRTPLDSRFLMTALDVSAALSGCARTVHRAAVNACNGYHYEWQEEADKKAEARAVKRATKLLEPYGVAFKTGGDPRGACFYLRTPKSERSNTWGGKDSGWAVV